MEWLLLLKKAIENGKESVSFKADTNDKKFIDKINNALAILPLNSGYNGFLINDFMLNYSSNGSVDLKIKYFQAPPETKAVEEFAIKFVSTSIKSSMTDLEKLIVVHDFIIKSVKYDYSLKNRSPYSAIKEKKSVCSGFALLAGKLLEIDSSYLWWQFEFSYESRIVDNAIVKRAVETQTKNAYDQVVVLLDQTHCLSLQTKIASATSKHLPDLKLH